MTSRSDSTDVRAEVMKLFYVEGLSMRAIARRLHLARRTVQRHLAKLPPAPKPTPVPHTSLLDPYDAAIRALLKDTPELKAPQILERIRELGYSGGITILRDRVQELRPKPKAASFLTLDFHPGEAMQIDWADFGFALPGVPRRVSAFVAVLCYSRLLYIEFTVSQAMGSFLRCMDRALAFFGGVTTADIFDNMKTVVLEHPRSGPVRFNPRFLSYANARGGFAVVACSPATPTAKGRVERPISFVRDRFWPGRRFRDLADLNVQASAWRDDFANRREHAETGKVPALAFEHEERSLLKPLSTTPFDTHDVEPVSATKLYRVPFDRNRYSVPWRLSGQSLVVRADDQTVAVFVGPKQVALHQRSWGTGEDLEHPSHRKKFGDARTSDPSDFARARFADDGERYFKNLAAGSRSLRRESLRLIFLAELFGNTEVQSAMAEVMRTGHVGVEYVEYVLRHRRKLSPDFTPLKLGNPALDQISLQEPDLSIYDRPARTLDPGEPPASDT
jgi:transposase